MSSLFIPIFKTPDKERLQCTQELRGIYDDMLEGMIKFGMRLAEAEANLKLRTTLLTKATNAYKKERNKKMRQAQEKPRKNSR